MIRAFRRAVLAPAVVAVTALLWVLLPLWLIAAAALSPLLPGRWRPLRLLWIAVDYATRESLLLKLDVVTQGPTPDASPGHPLLVCCRHAGPGDSFTLIHALMHWYDREPRVVLKDTLQWDPAIDVLLHRIPARFISPPTS